jgi:hypothetical protein
MTKHVVKYSHRPKREMTYCVVLAYAPTLLDLRAIHFKFHDRIKHPLIGFQCATHGPRKETSISTHNDVQ